MRVVVEGEGLIIEVAVSPSVIVGEVKVSKFETKQVGVV